MLTQSTNILIGRILKKINTDSCLNHHQGGGICQKTESTKVTCFPCSLKEHREEGLKVMTIDMTFEKREALMHEEIEHERRRADEQAKRADEQTKRADEQAKRADEANSRADAIAAEFAKYKAEHP